MFNTAETDEIVTKTSLYILYFTLQAFHIVKYLGVNIYINLDQLYGQTVNRVTVQL